jgi:malonyl-CoA O-methyltransferase
MKTENRKDRIAKAFESQAGVYDVAADVQWMVANRLAERIDTVRLPRAPRILEIGCGTGFLSVRLAEAFPRGDLVLTDIAASMLERCRARVGDGPRYVVLDGERPQGLEGEFDLIAASLAFQWFVDLPAALERLSALLAPGGRMMFSTLGLRTFAEWREAHAALGLACGTPVYPSPEDFPWPVGYRHRIEEELIRQPYADGRDFVKSLKVLGAGEPAPGYRPLSPGAFRRLLARLEGSFSATYHVLFGEISA